MFHKPSGRRLDELASIQVLETAAIATFQLQLMVGTRYTWVPSFRKIRCFSTPSKELVGRTSLPDPADPARVSVGSAHEDSQRKSSDSSKARKTARNTRATVLRSFSPPVDGRRPVLIGLSQLARSCSCCGTSPVLPSCSHYVARPPRSCCWPSSPADPAAPQRSYETPEETSGSYTADRGTRVSLRGVTAVFP